MKIKRRSWMAALAQHFERTRERRPHDPLMIVFDIDGTILDMRYLLLHVLKAYDKAHGTRWFRRLTLDDIRVHENQVDKLLSDLGLSHGTALEVLRWYQAHRWSATYTLHAHRPFYGVLEVIRWFQLQPNTFVGLNTGRPEALRQETLRCLNQLGKTYKVHFPNEHLYMNPEGWEQNVQASKAAGIRYFRERGFRIFAMVDNEPANLKAIARIDPRREILLLHANTLFESKRLVLPPHTVSGKVYDFTELIPENALPRHIQFVWHGINDEANLRQFLASPVTWGECDVRIDPFGKGLVLRHDPLSQEGEEPPSLAILLERLLPTDKGIKLDLKEGGETVDGLLAACQGIPEERLWFNGQIETLKEEGFRKLAEAKPGAILQAPIDFLIPLIVSLPSKAKEVLDILSDWGINRFSLNWRAPFMRTTLDHMDAWGLEVNLYNVPDLEAFLKAVLLNPRSITADFNFPQWYYFGRGSGEDGFHHRYRETSIDHPEDSIVL